MTRYRSRFRPERVRALVLQPRDLMILVVLFLCRCLTTRMLQAAFFSVDGLSRCRRRMRQLFDWGLVEREFLATADFGSEAVYRVGKAGLPYVLSWCMERGLEVSADEARSQTRMPPLSLLNHTLQVAGMALACREHLHLGTAVGVEWLFEALIRAQFEVRTASTGGWKTVIFKPDAALRLSAGAGRTIFLEADCGTETSQQLAVKLEAHRLFHVSGQFTTLYGEQAFTTLIATSGTMDGRARNLAAIAARVGAEFVLVTTLHAFIELGPLACPCLRTSGELTTLGVALHDLELKGVIT